MDELGEDPLSLFSFNMEFFLDKAATTNSLSQNNIPCWTNPTYFLRLYSTCFPEGGGSMQCFCGPIKCIEKPDLLHESFLGHCVFPWTTTVFLLSDLFIRSIVRYMLIFKNAD